MHSKVHIDLLTFTDEKVQCQLVYRTALGKVVTTQGIVRAIFKKNKVEEVAILENGLPIPTTHLLHIQRMEG